MGPLSTAATPRLPPIISCSQLASITQATDLCRQFFQASSEISHGSAADPAACCNFSTGCKRRGQDRKVIFFPPPTLLPQIAHQRQQFPSPAPLTSWAAPVDTPMGALPARQLPRLVHSPPLQQPPARSGPSRPGSRGPALPGR